MQRGYAATKLHFSAELYLETGSRERSIWQDLLLLTALQGAALYNDTGKKQYISEALHAGQRTTLWIAKT